MLLLVWRLSVGCFWGFLGLVLVLDCLWVPCLLLLGWLSNLDACTENPFSHSHKENYVFNSHLILQMNQNGTLLICDMTEMGMPSLNFECNQKNE